jgi:hypothetical protein
MGDCDLSLVSTTLQDNSKTRQLTSTAGANDAAVGFHRVDLEGCCGESSVCHGRSKVEERTKCCRRFCVLFAPHSNHKGMQSNDSTTVPVFGQRALGVAINMLRPGVPGAERCARVPTLRVGAVGVSHAIPSTQSVPQLG